MTDSNIASVQKPMDDLRELNQQFQSESEKKQLQLIPQLTAYGEPGLQILMDFLQNQATSPTLVVGKAYQTLYQSHIPEIQNFLQTHFPTGVIPLVSERNLDYHPLQKAFAKSDFQTADRLTIEKLCELAGDAAIKRKWLYFTEIEQFPSIDLHTIDQLWWIHSEGKFGFSVQRQIWLSLGQDFVKMWPEIGWKKDNNWTRYPTEFIWDVSAPKGHLPSSNQLRGNRVIAALFTHPVWTKNN